MTEARRQDLMNAEMKINRAPLALRCRAEKMCRYQCLGEKVRVRECVSLTKINKTNRISIIALPHPGPLLKGGGETIDSRSSNRRAFLSKTILLPGIIPKQRRTTETNPIPYLSAIQDCLVSPDFALDKNPLQSQRQLEIGCILQPT
jgi:hypothetical protein